MLVALKGALLWSKPFPTWLISFEVAIIFVCIPLSLPFLKKCQMFATEVTFLKSIWQGVKNPQQKVTFYAHTYC